MAKLNRRYKLTPSAALGFGIIAAYLLVALFAPWLTPHNPLASVGGAWQGPSRAFPLGTDSVGRDMLSRIIFGARLTLGLSLASTLLSFATGIGTGFIAAVSNRWIDAVLSRWVDIVLSVPQLIFALIIISVFGSSTAVLITTVGLLDSTKVFRLSRSLAMDIAAMEFVEVARLRGEGLWWIMRREILPIASPPLISEFGLRYCFNFLFVAGLSFLGLGVQPPLADWGGMVRSNAGAISFGLAAPFFPALALALMTIAVNLVVDWFLAIHSRPSGASAEM